MYHAYGSMPLARTRAGEPAVRRCAVPAPVPGNSLARRGRAYGSSRAPEPAAAMRA